MMQKLLAYTKQQLIYHRFRKLLESSEKWNYDQINNFQWQQLKKVLEIAYSYVPYYREHARVTGYNEKDIKNIDDFKRIVPIIDKNVLRANGELFLNEKFPASKRISFTTGGSSGNPVGLWLDIESTFIERAFIHYQWSRVGFKKGNRLAIIRGSMLIDQAKKPVLFQRYNKLLLLSSYHTTNEDYSAILRELIDFAPLHLHVYPSSLIGLAHYIKNHKPLKIPGLLSIFSASESLPESFKLLFQEVFQVPVYSHYGMAEHVALAGFGKNDDYYHFLPLYSFVEFMPDPRHLSLRRIVGSGFWNKAMVLLRYDTGDLCEVNDGIEENRESLLPSAKKLVGRIQDYLVLNDKSLLTTTAVVPGLHWNSFKHICQLQFEQSIVGQVVIHLKTTSDFSVQDEKEIIEIFAESTRGKLDVSIEIGGIQQTESGKVPLVVQSHEIKTILNDCLAV